MRTKKNILSPLRYPGGKGALLDLIKTVIYYNNFETFNYYEPYSGGAAVALGLLNKGTVENAFINDADKAVYAFWYSILHHTEEFIDRIINIGINISEWHSQKALLLKKNEVENIFDLGFATFYLNRCNRSGILNAGPIGGLKQTGNWKIDARFNRSELVRRIERIATFNNRITLSNLDALHFLKKYLPRGTGRKKVFVYLDPPYYKNGNKLYLNYYSDKDHKDLANYLNNQSYLNWLLTYDLAKEIEDLYDGQNIINYKLNYSLQQKKEGYELLINSKNISLPKIINNIISVEHEYRNN